MLIGARNELSDIIKVHDQATIIHQRSEKEQDTFFKDLVGAMHYRKKQLQSEEMERQKRVKTVCDNWIETDFARQLTYAKKISPRTVRKFKTHLQNFNIFGMSICVQSMW